MLSGIGQGKSFRWASRATGRPAIKETSAVETTGKGCCAATMAGHTEKTSSNFAVKFKHTTWAEIPQIIVADPQNWLQYTEDRYSQLKIRFRLHGGPQCPASAHPNFCSAKRADVPVKKKILLEVCGCDVRPSRHQAGGVDRFRCRRAHHLSSMVPVSSRAAGSCVLHTP